MKTLHEPNNYLLKAAKIPAHFNINSIKTWSSDINESRNGKCAHRETDIEGAARRSSVTGIFDETGDEENRFREKIDNEVEMNGKFENDSCRSRECLGNRRMLKLKDISVDGTHSDLDTENIVDNVTEIIPPPTPFSDQGVAINIEVVEPRTIMSLPCRMEKQSSAGLERKVVKAEGCWRKTASCEGHRRMTKERTHSGEAKRLEKRFRRIELEKVKRIELEPLEKNLSQVAPGELQPQYDCHVAMLTTLIFSRYYYLFLYPSMSYHITSYRIIRYHIIYHIISYHIITYHIISYHIISYHIISYHLIYHIISHHIISHHITSYHIISHHIISYHIISYHIISYHISYHISHHITSYHIISHHIVSYDIISYHIISYHIISYHIISYHSISYHIISYHNHILYHIKSHHIISYHIYIISITSYHIVSYHIISYHIISYHIISYRIMSSYYLNWLA